MNSSFTIPIIMSYGASAPAASPHRLQKYKAQSRIRISLHARSLEALGRPLGRLGGLFGASWGLLGGVLRTSWGRLGPFWCVLATPTAFLKGPRPETLHFTRVLGV